MANIAIEDIVPSALDATDQVLVRRGAGPLDHTMALVDPADLGAGDVTAASAFATDNVLIRADGTGKGVQGSVNPVSDAGEITFPNVASPATPAASSISLLGSAFAGFTLPAFVGADGRLMNLAPHLGEFNVSRFFVAAGNNAAGDATMSVSAIGTSTASAPADTNFHTMMSRADYLITVASPTAQSGLRTAANPIRVGRSTDAPGGFLVQMLWGPATGVSISTHRGFCGLRPTAVGSDAEPSSFVNIVGMAWDAADTNIQMMHNDGAGTATKIDLGASFPRPTADRTEVYEVQLYSPNETTQSVSYRVIRYNTTGKTIAAQASGTITTDLPAVTTFLGLRTSLSVGGTSSVIGTAVGGWLIGTRY